MIPLPAPATAEHYRNALFSMAVGEGALWVIGDALDPRLFKVALRSSRLLADSRCRSCRSESRWVQGPSGSPMRSTTCSCRSTRPVGASCSASRPVAVPTASRWAPAASGSWRGIAGEVERIDPASGRIVERIEVGPGLREIAVGANGVWVTRDAI